MTTRIYITCTGYGKRGPLYTARLGSAQGEVLVSNTIQPALDSARVLVRRGADPLGILEMWDTDRPYPRLTGQLGRMAGQTIMERDNRSGPAFEKFKTFRDGTRRTAVATRSGGRVTSGVSTALDQSTAVRDEGGA